MSTTVPLYLKNYLGYTIAQCWMNHVTSDGSVLDKGYAANIPPNGNSSGWTMTIVHKTDDLFTVMWFDPAGNLWGSPFQFSAECSLDGGGVEIDLVGATGQVNVVQGSAARGSAPIIEYIVAPPNVATSSASPSSRAAVAVAD